MAKVLVYEINTRCWLRGLSERENRPIGLVGVPGAELDQWCRWGITHIWLMGLWTSGPRARAHALSGPELRLAYSGALPGWTEADVGGSPYAIADYTVPQSMGGDNGLAAFRQRLHRHGLKLLLDFVPNHLGLDHPWIEQRPELFVQSDVSRPETFPVRRAQGTCWLAHGKDPNFPAWADTAQPEYRLRTTHSAMRELLETVAGRCDGVRCDMAMLVIEEVFAKTWASFPASRPPDPGEFWAETIAMIKAAHPGFLFLAEAYWGLEPRLQRLGFDYTYDKTLYDKLAAGDETGVRQHLSRMPAGPLAAGAHFIENHDEPRAAATFSPTRHRAAARLILSLPGMCLLHEGQLSGARRRAPVQLVRRGSEPEDAEIREFYDDLLSSRCKAAGGQGEGGAGGQFQT